MRKPRDFDAQLKALNEKAKQLKDRKFRQYGDLVIETGVEVIDIESSVLFRFRVILCRRI